MHKLSQNSPGWLYQSNILKRWKKSSWQIWRPRFWCITSPLILCLTGIKSACFYRQVDDAQGKGKGHTHCSVRWQAPNHRCLRYYCYWEVFISPGDIPREDCAVSPKDSSTSGVGYLAQWQPQVHWEYYAEIYWEDYCALCKGEVKLPMSQHALTIFDCFKGQTTSRIKALLRKIIYEFLQTALTNCNP